MSAERSFKTLHTQAEHAVAARGGRLARAIGAHAQASQRMREAQAANAAARDELRRWSAAGPFHPFAFEQMRGMVRHHEAGEAKALASLSECVAQLEAARTDLARARQREADLAAALRAEQSRLAAERQRCEALALDDLWLLANRRPG